jgi:hypothetical protein
MYFLTIAIAIAVSSSWITAVVVSRKKDHEWGKWLDAVNMSWNRVAHK